MSGNRIEIGGALTLDSASVALQTGRDALARLPAGADAVFDLGQVAAVDSAGLALVFAWLRDAQAAQRKLTFVHLPQQLLSLAAVYGVGDLLPQA
jgi:phospholipid transport system transporter-binding protein